MYLCVWWHSAVSHTSKCDIKANMCITNISSTIFLAFTTSMTNSWWNIGGKLVYNNFKVTDKRIYNIEYITDEPICHIDINVSPLWHSHDRTSDTYSHVNFWWCQHFNTSMFLMLWVAGAIFWLIIDPS